MKNQDGSSYNFRLDGRTIMNAITGKGNRWDGPAVASNDKQKIPSKPREIQDISLIRPGKYLCDGNETVTIRRQSKNKNNVWIVTFPAFERKGSDVKDRYFVKNTVDYDFFQKGKQLISPQEDLKELFEDSKGYMCITQSTPDTIIIDPDRMQSMFAGTGGGPMFPAGKCVKR